MKKLNFQFILALILVINSPLCFAFFCPTNFSQVNIGDSIEQISKACGAPDAQTEMKKANENVPQEWSYFVPTTVATPTSNYAHTNSLRQTQGTMRANVAFDAQGKVINLSVNGIGVGATSICGRNVQLGDTRDSIKAACGEPQFINKDANPAAMGGKPKEIDVTEFTYNTNPPTTLVFQNGILVEKR